MNPNMNPMMINQMNQMMMSQMMGANGYGPVQFPPQGVMMPQMASLPNQLHLSRHQVDLEGQREEELNENIDDAAAHYPSMMWPQMYPMMMMMPMSPIGQQPGDTG